MDLGSDHIKKQNEPKAEKKTETKPCQHIHFLPVYKPAF